jgi:hypothetical protein
LFAWTPGVVVIAINYDGWGRISAEPGACTLRTEDFFIEGIKVRNS